MLIFTNTDGNDVAINPAHVVQIVHCSEDLIDCMPHAAIIMTIGPWIRVPDLWIHEIATKIDAHLGQKTERAVPVDSDIDPSTEAFAVDRS